MIIGAKLAEGFIIVEFSLIVLLVLATYVLKILYTFKNRRKSARTDAFRIYLQNIIEKPFNDKSEYKIMIPKSWHNLEIIIYLINYFDHESAQPSWLCVRKLLLQQIALPIARRAYCFRDWKQRFFAVTTFHLAPQIEDEAAIVSLANDKIPLVNQNAFITGVRLCSAQVIDLCIGKIADLRRLRKEIYLQVFDHASPAAASIVKSHLVDTENPYARAACYAILLKFPPMPIDSQLNKDCHAPQLDLQIAALKYLAYLKVTAAIPLLLTFLNNTHWEVKVVVLNLLGKLHATEAIPQIALCLQDAEWWVRLNAGQALKNMGSLGMNVLKKQEPSSDKFAYDVAQYLLALK